MKLGILCLLRDGHRVRYRNADQSWNFHLKKSTASGETVLYMKSRYLDSPSAALSVMICGVTSDVFMLDHYLPFCSNIIREVSSSLCDGGALLEAGDKYEDQGYPGAFLEMYDGYVYVKGIFVVQHDWIHIPVNLLNVSLSRDRGMIADGKEAIRNIAAIWSTVLISEATMLVDVRKYTKLYLDIVQRDFGCYEYRTLKHMDGEVARALLKFIREEVSQNAFPFKKGNAKEAAKIEKCLSKIPYSCTESLYQCLRKSQEVLTVVEAQEAAFCDSSLDTKAIERVLPRVVVGFVEYTMGGDVSVVFKFGAKLTVFLKDGVLMVNSHFLEEGCSPRTALKVLNLIEWEFTKDLGEEERERINLRAKEFIMGTSFRSQIVYPYEKDNGPRNAASQNISREPVENGIGDAVGTNDSNVGNYASPVVESDVQGRNTKIRRIDHVKLLPVEEDSDGSSLKLYEQTTLFLPSVQIDIMHKVLTPCDSNVQDSNVQEVIVGELGELPNNLAISRKNQHRLEMNDGISVVNSDGKNELFRIHVTPRSV